MSSGILRIVATPFVAVGMAKAGSDLIKKQYPPTKPFAFDANQQYEYNKKILINFPEGSREVYFQGVKLSRKRPCTVEGIHKDGSFVSDKAAFWYSSPVHRALTGNTPHITVFYSDEPVEGIHTDGGTDLEGEKLFGEKVFKHPKLKAFSEPLTKENDPGIMGAVKRMYEKTIVKNPV